MQERMCVCAHHYRQGRAGTSQDMRARTLPARFPCIKNLSKLLIFQLQTSTSDNCLFCKHSGNMKQHTPKLGIILCWLLTICATMLIHNQAVGQENTEVSSAYRSESLLL